MSHFISQLRRNRMSIESANRQYISRLQRSRTLRRLNRKLVADQCEKPMSHFISRLRRSSMSIESANRQYISRLRRSRILRRLNRNELQTGAKNRCYILSASSGGITCLWKTRLISGSADSGGITCLWNMRPISGSTDSGGVAYYRD